MAIAHRNGKGRLDMVDLVGLLLAAGGPIAIPARVAWPLHQALRELDREIRRDGLLARFPATLDFRPSPDVGLAAAGVGGALLTLLQTGALVAEGNGTRALLRADQSELTPYRRLLMGLHPDIAEVLYRAGMRWAALVATSAKNRSTAGRSSGGTPPSGTPKRLHALPGNASIASRARVPVCSLRLVTR